MMLSRRLALRRSTPQPSAPGRSVTGVLRVTDPQGAPFRGLLRLLLMIGVGVGLLGMMLSLGGPVRSMAQGSSTDWPMLGHDLWRSNSTTNQVDPPCGPQRNEAVWVRDFASGDETTSELVFNQYQPIVVGKLVYVGTSRNNMYALYTEDGSIVWSYHAEEPGMIMASPAVQDGVLYYGSTNGYFYALDAQTGELQWKREIVKLGGFRTSPAVVGDAIYLGGEDGVFYALDATDGHILWSYDTGAPILNTAAVDVSRERIYFANEGMYAFALDFQGNLTWKSAQLHGSSTRNYYPVIVDGGNAVIFRTSPGSASRALNGGDTLLGRAAGLNIPGDFTHLKHGDAYGTDVYAEPGPTDVSEEQNAIVNWLTNEHPEYETFYVLNAADGTKRYTAPVLWSGGSGEVGEPPVVSGDGTVYVRARSYWGNVDFSNCVYHFGTPAILNLSTGRLDLFRLPADNNPYSTGIFMIGDEASAMSIGGNRLYFYSHGDVVGSVLLSGQQAGYVTISRDVPHTITKEERDPALPFGQDALAQVRFMGGAGGGSSLFCQPPVIADDKIFFVSQGMVGMYKSGFTGQTTYIAASRGTQPSTGPIGVPDTSTLESYVTEIESYPELMTAAADLRAELEAQVQDLVSGERYEPFIQMAGKKQGYIYFLDPTEEAYILALAYPHLSSELQGQVRAYLEEMWAEVSDPLRSSFSYSNLTGRRRERYQVNNDAGEYAVENGRAFTTAPEERLYNLWGYAYYMGDWDFIVEHWEDISSVAHGIDPTAIQSGPPAALSVNRKVASLIGYARMADHLRQVYPDNTDYQTEYQWAVEAAATALQTRLQWEEDHRPTGTPWSPQWMQEEGGYNVFMDTDWGRGGQIARYEGLVPPIARALRDYAGDDIQLQNAFIDVVVPAQHLAWSFIPNRGEIFSNLVHQARQVFLAKALLMQEDAEVLRDYLSHPWCRGDLYYIERLVWTIRASLASILPSMKKAVSHPTAYYGDVLTYTITLVGSGTAMTLTDEIPAAVSYIPGSARREPEIGVLTETPEQLQWTGVLSPETALNVTFQVTVGVTGPMTIVNRALTRDEMGQTLESSAATIANGYRVHLPVIIKH